ncbi:MAG: sugar phosphate isomerase/epimerase [Bacteroidales bacterium]|nr:sugar phosphate isomerase/epimerase [Bacteroidales bacterium]
MQSRRNFLKTTLLSTFAMTMSPRLLRATPGKPAIGLQLYTIRDAMKADTRSTLEEVSRIGYTWLEAAGYADGQFYGMSPKEFNQLVTDLGMELVSSHATFNKESQQPVIDAHAEAGVKYLVYPVMPIPEKETAGDFKRAAQRLNEIGEACAKAGICFGYHNHAFEFERFEDQTGYDILLNETDPALVFFQADLYWIVYAGIDPEDYFNLHPGRFEHWHVKDMEDSPERSFAEVGEGVIDFEKIFKMKDLSGMKYFFVEQDACKRDPMESIFISYENLLNIVY